MKVVVIGDVGWREMYHLGDEAMTEVALDMLRARGASDITLIAGHPDVTQQLYGVHSINRIGFAKTWNRTKLDGVLSQSLRAIRGEEQPSSSLATVEGAVAASAAVIIAGGGNLNSEHAYHIYERYALMQLSRKHQVPLYVVSQTVGPHLIPEDAERVREILAYATCFGAREKATYDLLLDLGGRAGSVVHTMDDAMLITPTPEDDRSIAERRPKGRYIVGSFTNYAGTSGMAELDYYSAVATTLDEIAERHDVDIALVPHTGSLLPSTRKGDQLSNDAIVAASKSGRVTDMGMLTAREAVSLAEGAELSLSTRYHPAVFSPAVGTPAVSISTSLYASIRMRGASQNLGLEAFVLPVASWQTGEVGEAVAGALGAEMPSLSVHLSGANDTRQREQRAWWDRIVQSIESGSWRPGPALSPIEHFSPSSWGQSLDAVTRASDAWGRAEIALRDARAELAAAASQRDTSLRERSEARREVKAVQKKLDEMSARNTALELALRQTQNRIAIRLANRLSTLLRPFRRSSSK